jgi:hypothetical protein
MINWCRFLVVQRVRSIEPSESVGGREAGVEPTGKYTWRLSEGSSGLT